VLLQAPLCQGQASLLTLCCSQLYRRRMQAEEETMMMALQPSRRLPRGMLQLNPAPLLALLHLRGRQKTQQQR
jgi:hypothetical protein